MATLTYHFPTWNWSFAPARWANPEPPRAQRTIMGRLHSQLQHDPARIAAGEDAPGVGATVAQPAALQWMGQSGDEGFAVREWVSIKHRGRQVLTAVRTAENQLNLLAWRVNADGSVVCTGASGAQTGQATQISLARARKFVVAYRTGEGRLHLISWDVSNTGAIYRAGESTGQPERMRRIKLVAVDDDLLVTACITKQKQLKLISWRLGQDDTLIQVHDCDATGELVRSVAVVVVPGAKDNHQLITVVRTLAGQVRLLRWTVTASGLITAMPSPIELPVVTTQMHAVVDAHGQIVTSLRTLDGHLRLIVWRLAPGGSVQPVFDTGDGGERIRHHALMRSANGVLLAVCTAAHQIKLIAWAVNQGGMSIRTCESEAIPAPVGAVSLCPELLDGNAPVLTAIRTAQGKLKLLSWRA